MGYETISLKEVVQNYGAARMWGSIDAYLTNISCCCGLRVFLGMSNRIKKDSTLSYCSEG